MVTAMEERSLHGRSLEEIARRRGVAKVAVRPPVQRALVAVRAATDHRCEAQTRLRGTPANAGALSASYAHCAAKS